MPNPSEVRRFKGVLRHSVDQLFLLDVIRYAIVWIRFVWFVHIRRRLRTLESTDPRIARNTISHNIKGLRDLAVTRSYLLVRPLSVIEALGPEARVLSIGPRTEGELFNLAAHGFSWRHIRAVDLISYSPKVDLGDMHDMRYASDAFDAVILGWVLAYSEDPVRAAAEVTRVTRNGGVVAVGVEVNPLSRDDIVRTTGYLPGAQRRIESCKQILGFFGSAVDHVYYEHTVRPVEAGKIGALCVIFSIRK